MSKQRDTNGGSRGDRTHPFSRYLRTLARETTASPELFEEAWDALKKTLRSEIRRRGLWQLSTAYLGVMGTNNWSASPDCLDEFATDCYVFVFIDRLENLLSHLANQSQVEGLVVRGIQNFVHERQRENDQVGTRVFNLLRSATEQAHAEGELILEPPDHPVEAGSLLLFESRSSKENTASAGRLRELTAHWSDELLPDFFTTTGRGIPRLQIRLRALIATLEGQGVRAFFLRDLVAVLRDALRPQWAEMLATKLGVGRDDQGAVDFLTFLSQQAIPGKAYEQRQSFQALSHCVEGRLRDHTAEPMDLDALRTLWETLRTWAEAEDRGARGEPSEGMKTIEPKRQIPSQREVSKILGIPRTRLSSLYRTLGDFVNWCRDPKNRTLATRHSTAPEPSPGGRSMDPKKRQESLLRMTTEAMTRLTRQAEDPGAGWPIPGAIYTVASTTEPLVEWVLLSEATTDGATVLAVPADTNPLAGGDDWVVPVGSPGGPLTLRSSLAVDLPAELFAEQSPSRKLSADQLKLAKDAHNRAERREAGWRKRIAAELGPDYQRWMDRVAAVANELRSEDSPASERPPVHPRNNLRTIAKEPETGGVKQWRNWPLGLAAAFAAAAVGASIWGVTLSREIARRDKPAVVRSSVLFRAYEVSRGTTTELTLQPGVRSMSLELGLSSELSHCEELQLTFLDHDGVILERLVVDTEGEEGSSSVELPRAFIEIRPAVLRVVPICDGQEMPSMDHSLHIVIE